MVLQESPSAVPSPSHSPHPSSSSQLHKKFKSESTLTHPQTQTSNQNRASSYIKRKSVGEETASKSPISTPIDERILVRKGSCISTPFDGRVLMIKDPSKSNASVVPSQNLPLQSLHKVEAPNEVKAKEVKPSLGHLTLKNFANSISSETDVPVHGQSCHYEKKSSFPIPPVSVAQTSTTITSSNLLPSTTSSITPDSKLLSTKPYSSQDERSVSCNNIAPISSTLDSFNNRKSFGSRAPLGLCRVPSDQLSSVPYLKSGSADVSVSGVIPPPIEFRSVEPAPNFSSKSNFELPPASLRDQRSVMSASVPSSFLNSLVSSPHDEIVGTDSEQEDTPPPVCYATMPSSNSSTFIVTELSNHDMLPVFPISTVSPIPSMWTDSIESRQNLDHRLQSVTPSKYTPSSLLTTLHKPLTMVAHSHTASPHRAHCTFPIQLSHLPTPTYSAERVLDTEGYSRSQPYYQAASGPSVNAAPTTMSGNITSVTTSATNPSSPPAVPQKMSVSDKMKFFEKAMEEQHQPSPKPEKVFSFLSQDEIERMKQEEEKKIASLSRSELKTLTNMVEHEEDDEDRNEGFNEADESSNRNAFNTPLRDVPVRTAKAEKRRKERLLQEGILSDEEDKELSPAEQRALRAEKRAAWRQARFKSLEQDALQAQMVIKKMSEMIDSDQNRNSTSPETATSPLPTVDVEEPDSAAFNNNNLDNSHLHHNSGHPDGENNVEVEVETTREKIISLELCSPEQAKDNLLLEATTPVSPTLHEEDEEEEEEEEQQSSDIPSSTPTSPTTEDGPESNLNKKRRRKRNKKKH